jgi:hypothetical protein
MVQAVIAKALSPLRSASAVQTGSDTAGEENAREITRSSRRKEAQTSFQKNESLLTPAAANEVNL